MNVAFPGYRGGLFDQAARRFAPAAERIPLAGPDEVMHAVVSHAADVGVLAMASPTGAFLMAVLDRLAEHGLRIVAEVEVLATVALLAPSDERGIAPRVVAAPVGTLARSSGFCRRHPEILFHVTSELEPWLRAQAATGVGGYGVLAPASAAEPLGLQVREDCVDDAPGTRLRCAIVAPQGTRPAVVLPPATVTLVVFSVPHQSGALHRALSVFAMRDLDLTNLSLRREPTSGPNAATFYATVRGDGVDPRMVKALDHLRELAAHVVVLGSFAIWEETDPRAPAVAPGFEWALPDSRGDL